MACGGLVEVWLGIGWREARGARKKEAGGATPGSSA